MTDRRAPARLVMRPPGRCAMKAAFLGWAALALLAGVPGLAQDSTGASTEFAKIPPAVGFVNDDAGVLDEETRAKLEAFLDQLKQKTGVEFAVLTVRTTAPETPDAYKVRVFQAWGLGQRGKDNGLLMLVALAERQVKFETGYGLEGVVPDGFLGRVFRHEMQERFRANDYAGGIVAGVVRVAQRIAADQGVTLEWNGRTLRYRTEPRRSLPPWLIVLLVLIVLIALSRAGGSSRRRRRGWMNPGGWGGGFGGWGGGGFGGGGFGGGGGGGGGFGGFGGGRSGGGGGGGSW